MSLGLRFGTQRASSSFSSWLARLVLPVLAGSSLAAAIQGINFNVDDPGMSRPSQIALHA